MSKLEDAAKAAMKDVLGLRPGEEVLIVTNFEGDAFDISKALYDETKALGGKPVMAVQDPRHPWSSQRTWSWRRCGHVLTY